MALVASLAIAAAYLSTEAERQAVRDDAQTIAGLYGESVQLTEAIRNEEAAVDDYLLSGKPEASSRYSTAVETEMHLIEEMRLQATAHPAVQDALDTLREQTAGWRQSYARIAIEAVDHGSKDQIAAISSAAASDQEPTVTAMRTVTDQLILANEAVAAQDDALTRTRAIAAVIAIALMLVATIASLVLTRRWVTRPLGRLLATATKVEAGANIPFESDSNDEIGGLARALERMRAALRHDVDQSGIFNRFTEVTTFAADDAAVAAANLEALRLLVAPDAGVVHVLNRSKDRAVPDATIGQAIADVLPMHALSGCPAIVRGSIHVSPDASEPLSVHCPVYPVDHGTLACVPLAHGEVVGAIHLFWERPRAFGLEPRAGVARIAQHAALAIANRRLLAALQGMASTDARTGLANSRAFDQMLEDTLSARREDETVAVLMLDVDNFKDFNDRYGHPSGDVALSSFADVLRSCLREGDIAARYGGEEFAVVLRDVDRPTSFAVAERIRSRTENTLISLAPGITDRVTVSIGIASAPDEAHDRVTLLRLADEALYRAKQAGRNRIEHISGVGPVHGTKATPVPAIAPVNGRTPRRKAPRSASA